MLSSGVPVVRALEEMAAYESNLAFRAVLEEIKMRVEGEGALSAALAEHPKVFPAFYLGAFRAGEAGGTLPEVLANLVGTIERQMEFDAQLKQAMMYPIFVSALLLGVGVLYLGFVMPKILEMVRELGGKLPLMTRILIGVSDGFQRAWYLPLGGLVLGSIGFTRLRSTAGGRLWLDGLLLRIPLVGPLNQKVILAKFSHFLSLLLSSGYEILPSLELVKDTVGNRSSVRAIETVHARIQAGDSLSNSMRGLGFIPFVISMIAVGEKSGMVTEQLDKVAEYYEREVDRGLKKLLALIEPILLVVFGAMAAVVILSTFMPMYQSMSLAK
jgi:type IV pilus assembly protein PilC